MTIQPHKQISCNLPSSIRLVRACCARAQQFMFHGKGSDHCKTQIKQHTVCHCITDNCRYICRCHGIASNTNQTDTPNHCKTDNCRYIWQCHGIADNFMQWTSEHADTSCQLIVAVRASRVACASQALSSHQHEPWTLPLK